LNSAIKVYVAFCIVFAAIGLLSFFGVAFPPSEHLSKGPIEIGVGPSSKAFINKTELFVLIPEQSIDIRVTIRFNETVKYFVYAILPYRIDNATPYAIYNSGWYPDPRFNIGNFSRNFMNTVNGSAVNASLQINPSFMFNFAGPDLKAELTLGVFVKLRNAVTALDYPFGASQTVILTFFGDVTGIWTDEMNAFAQPSSQITIQKQFIVNLQLPPSAFFSESQPSPISYYIKQDRRWVMFSMDFREGRYAQSLFCTLTNPTVLAWKQVLLFAGGVFIGISSSFLVQIVRCHIEKKGAEPRGKKEKERPESSEERQSLDIGQLLSIVETEFEDRLWMVKIKNPWLICILALDSFVLLYLALLLYFITTIITSGLQYFQPENAVALLIALVAALISFVSLGVGISKQFSSPEPWEELLNYNYKKKENQVNDADKPVLKALLMMKSKHPELDLRDISSQVDLNKKDLVKLLYK
jgi:hypothetical protein